MEHILDQTRFKEPKPRFVEINEKTIKKYFPGFYSSLDVQKMINGLLSEWKTAGREEGNIRIVYR